MMYPPFYIYIYIKIISINFNNAIIWFKMKAIKLHLQDRFQYTQIDAKTIIFISLTRS